MWRPWYVGAIYGSTRRCSDIPGPSHAIRYQAALRRKILGSFAKCTSANPHSGFFCVCLCVRCNSRKKARTSLSPTKSSYFINIPSTNMSNFPPEQNKSTLEALKKSNFLLSMHVIVTKQKSRAFLIATMCCFLLVLRYFRLNLSRKLEA